MSGARNSRRGRQTLGAPQRREAGRPASIPSLMSILSIQPLTPITPITPPLPCPMASQQPEAVVPEGRGHPASDPSPSGHRQLRSPGEPLDRSQAAAPPGRLRLGRRRGGGCGPTGDEG